MSSDAASKSLSQIAAKPDLSFTTIRWVTEIPDPENEHSVEAVAMFSVVGEQYRLPNIEAAAKAIAEQSSFLPPRFWLVPDDANQHDNLAVAVYAVVEEHGYHVGFLPKQQARDFRSNMTALEQEGRALEVLGCITQNRTSTHPNARIYMPVDFAALVRSGYTADTSNHVSWLADSSPVAPRVLKNGISESFTFEELCKIYCWHARKQGWNCFPDTCESKAEGIRSAGIGLSRESFDPFTRQPTSDTSKNTPAAASAKSPLQREPRKQWFYRAGGQEYGPVDAARLKLAADSGEIVRDDSVRRGDMEHWVPASNVKGLFSEAGAGTGKQGGTTNRRNLCDLLYVTGDLLPPWGAGDFVPSVAAMFDGLPPASECGSRPLLLNGEKSGGATIFFFDDSDAASQHYLAVERQLAPVEGNAVESQGGAIAELGQRARFLYMKAEMPAMLNLPPMESTDLAFVRDNWVVHVRIVGALPEEAQDYATKIDGRIISQTQHPGHG